MKRKYVHAASSLDEVLHLHERPDLPPDPPVPAVAGVSMDMWVERQLIRELLDANTARLQATVDAGGISPDAEAVFRAALEDRAAVSRWIDAHGDAEWVYVRIMPRSPFTEMPEDEDDERPSWEGGGEDEG